jgi:DNA-binding NarL/FixJ family response regulator
MSEITRIAVLEDHPAMVAGYQYFLRDAPDMQIVASAAYADELEPMLARQPINLLILDVNVSTTAASDTPYPMLYLIPKLLQQYPEMAILVISMHKDRGIIKAVVEAGASGYVLKEDQAAMRELISVVRTVASGGVYFSQKAHQEWMKRQPLEPLLTSRQLEVLSVMAAYPDFTTADAARQLNIAPSTARNLLSTAYLRLGVRNCAAAVTKARQLGLITPFVGPPPEPVATMEN